MDWRNFIDEICSSEIIISESLHGIIAAEAYGIPNIWVRVAGQEHDSNWDFKYQDFFYSIGKYDIQVYEISESTTLEEIRWLAKKWRPGTIDVEKLINACPVKLNFSYFQN